MAEKIRTQETLTEAVPSHEKVDEMLTIILAGRAYVAAEKEEDHDGYKRIIFKTFEPGTSDVVEVLYERAKIITRSDGSVRAARSYITRTLFDSEGIPCGAGTQYGYVDGKWVSR